MNRNPDTVRQTRFGPSNPPDDEQVAQARKETLDQEIAFLEVTIDLRVPGDFSSEEAYTDWRKRAISAFGFMRSEATFIRQWLASRGCGGVETLAFNKRQKELNRIALGIRRQAQELADEIGKTYAPVFSPDNSPPDIASARDRLDRVICIKRQVEIAFTTVTNAWTAHPLQRQDLPGVKAPLQRMAASIEAELVFLRGFIRSSIAEETRVAKEAKEKRVTEKKPPAPRHGENAPKTPKPPTSVRPKTLKVPSGPNWRLVCIAVIDRALEAGLVLTPEEIEVINLVCAYEGLPALQGRENV